MSSNSLALKGRSDAYTQVDNFLHAYARGGDELVNGHPSYTVDQAAEQILREQASWQKAPGDSVLTLSYSFLTKPNDFFNTPWKYVSDIYSLGKFSAFSAQQQAQAKLSLQSWSDVTNIHFVDAGQGDQGDLTFGNFSSSVGGAAFAFLPDVPDALKGQSWYLINSSYSANVNPANGNYGRQTLTHEIGHTLGLSHPGDYNAGEGDPTYADATYAEDTRAYSVMSYWEEQNTGQDFKGAYSSAPLLDDIAAIQKLYGANLTTRTGDTVYGFNSNTERDFYSATSSSSKLVFSVWDAGGNDTLDFSGFSQNQKINLNEKALSDVGGLKGNVSIAAGVTVENAIGGSGSDLLIGNDVANVLKGGAGNDILYGGLGADQLWGGAGADTFVYGDIAESSAAAPDTLRDFVSGQDKIDLSGLDAFVNGGLVLQYVDAFAGQAGQAILSYDAASKAGSLAIDLSGDAHADFAINLIGQATQADIVV
ncbi:TPA: serralysin family metalloprotease AprA [Pseudomonas aeruginosa]|uniref:serralysin family metalloprotease AprA n=1 Tax=Pseudomonas aeruginosa TaxID=287 RepID=UPI00071BF210|nr:serralysin family metalloprotease AprA [Pseudomonas aeruginosa]AZZ12895.1 serine 3-dehydrogenase [Pseudomonas aeruginosa]EKN9354644.1 serralysin family metalloprotease AprA [Pseudomonas aeruginosa]KSJ38523.1 serine 3-dehydrogenase [Pseudomonas aeruginosa]MBG5165340.1 serralysin family metalloprotease AprA [Pseudomonas aeruginosa]MBS9747282.1 serralysin family metalloprotease AprA [Pseudomonas aeruginosa]